MRRYVVYAVGMAVIWVMLWDEVSVPNVAAGLLVSTLILVAFPLQPDPTRDWRRIRPLRLAQLLGFILRELAVSNVTVALLILRRRQELRSGIVACDMRTASSKSLSTIANIVALSPGTMAVDAVIEPPTLFIHVLTLDDPLTMRRHVADLEVLVIRALGSEAEREALAASDGERT